jgi:DinB family protein
MAERPAPDEYAPFFAGYVKLVPETEVLPVLSVQVSQVRRLAEALSADRETFRYAPGKWSIREVFGHICDGERVFGYRAFCISRGDQTPLPGFDENDYVAESAYDQQAVAELADDFAGLREANLAVLGRLDPARWVRGGNANGNPVSVRALAFIMAGHVRHHLGVLKARYGLTA